MIRTRVRMEAHVQQQHQTLTSPVLAPKVLKECCAKLTVKKLHVAMQFMNIKRNAH